MWFCIVYVRQYCDALVSDSPKNLLDRFQKVKNNTACLIHCFPNCITSSSQLKKGLTIKIVLK